jgi:HK97 family phage prohead protease
MTMIRGVFAAEIRALGDDEVEVVMSTATIARDGHVLMPQGANLENFRRNPIVLWQHDQKSPVGIAEQIAVYGDKITARVRFAPLGVSVDADKVRGLVKSGIVRSVSVGFDPQDGEPLDPKKPLAGQRFTRWELLECSFVSAPADPGAVVTARKIAPAIAIANARARHRRGLLIARSPVLSRERRLAELRRVRARTHFPDLSTRLTEVEMRKPMTAARWVAAIRAADDREAQWRIYNFSAGRSQPISQAERIADYQRRQSDLAARRA